MKSLVSAGLRRLSGTEIARLTLAGQAQMNPVAVFPQQLIDLEHLDIGLNGDADVVGRAVFRAGEVSRQARHMRRRLGAAAGVVELRTAIARGDVDRVVEQNATDFLEHFGEPGQVRDDGIAGRVVDTARCRRVKSRGTPLR